MNTQILIDGIVRQTTVLIAQLATARGGRTPPLRTLPAKYSPISPGNCSDNGVSRKAAADMFGMALRTYRRKVQRFWRKAKPVAGRSLWGGSLRLRRQASRDDARRRLRALPP